MLVCPIDGAEFQPYEGMRWDINNLPWCKPCQDEFDNIDWEEYHERNRE